MASATSSNSTDPADHTASQSTPSDESGIPLDLLTYRPGTPCKSPAPEAEAEDLIGRCISVMWQDNTWYDAIVVAYLHKKDQHRLVYTTNAEIEEVNLSSVEWELLPKRNPSPRQPSLVGATIEFLHPYFNRVFRAIVYRTDKTGGLISVAYLDDGKTDNLKGGGWVVIKDSPCVLHDSS